MLTTNEDTTRQDTLRNVIFDEDVCDIHCTELAWEAVWHFFIGGDDDFTRLYERRQVNTHTEEDEVYVFCSEYLFDQEFYIANLLDEGATKELTAMVILPLSEQIENILDV